VSPAAFVVEFYHLEVAYTAVHCVNGMPVQIACSDLIAQGVCNYYQIVPVAKSQWSGVITKEVATPMAGHATTSVAQGV